MTCDAEPVPLPRPLSFRARLHAPSHFAQDRLIRTGSLILIVGLLAAACERSPVEWSVNRTVTPVSPGVALTASGDTTTDSLASSRVAPAGATPACPGSVRMAQEGGLLVAVWWTARHDSSARLVTARSRDAGRTWSAATPVDTLDRGVSGCRRPPAAVAVDSVSGYVHVSYALVAPEGAGIFFSHSMDSGATFHAPVPIMYGEHPGFTSVAASGDIVAVAFEDPGGDASRVGLALSRTMGHIFEDRLLPVSGDNGAATQPLVAVAGHRIAVAWREGAGTRGGTDLRIRAGLIH